MIKHMVAAMAAAVALALSAQEAEKAAPPLNWDAAPVDIVLQAYAESIDKIVLKDPGVPNATISLKARDGQQLTLEEYLEAIEVVLEMNGVHIEPYGEKFIRAIPRNKARKEGIPLILDPDTELRDSGKVVSMMIPFKNIAVAEAQKLLEGLKSDTGILLVFERTNAILVTDTEQNINRMIEIAKTVDVASPVLENVFVRQIKYASVSDVKTILENIVKESQAAQEKENGKGAATPAAQNADRSADRRLLGRRPAANNAPEAQPAANVNESVVMSVSDADRGMIRGKVIMMSDERSNKLIVITQKANMDFFDKIIEQMDVETTPDVKVEVIRLKYADAEEVSDMINDLIGNASGNKNSSKNNTNQNAQKGTSANVTSGTTRPANTRTAGAAGESKAGELSKDNVVVLADKRINGLVIMARTQDIPVLHQIIESMDVKLSQVLIETVIIEVTLKDELATGIDWVHGMQQKGSQYNQAIGGGGGSASPVPTSGATASTLIDGASTTLPTIFPAGGSGLSYSLFSRKLDLAAIVKASKSDANSKYIASPIVMTVDNKEATIDATENRQFLTGWTAQSSGYSGGGQPTPNYSAKDIGLKLKITPKINPNGTVMLTVDEEYSQFMAAAQSMLVPKVTSGSITYETEGVDLAIERKMSADILLENMQTVVLGGLTETKVEETDAGIPVLKDIPWVGKWLFGKVEQKENRKELLVFLTPYVLNDAQAAQAEALRRKKTMSAPTPWEDHGWSASELADPISQKEQMRRLQEEWELQDKERKARRAIEESKLERVKALEKMDEEDRERWVEEHKEELEREHQEELNAQLMDEESQNMLRELAAEMREQSSEAAAE